MVLRVLRQSKGWVQNDRNLNTSRHNETTYESKEEIAKTFHSKGERKGARSTVRPHCVDEAYSVHVLVMALATQSSVFQKPKEGFT